ncbi:MAG: (2Fe-2S)-binding protein, partial [Actinobacteria bacterium]|nr:(2Fe-2S)-binding protein [Actinomycetota bacterium]
HSAPAVTHPITQTLQRGRHRRHAGCHLGLPTDARGEGWLSIATLTADTQLLRALLSRTGEQIGSDRCDVQASIFLENYTWQLVLPLAGALVAEQRVALPAAHDLALRPSNGHAVELAISPARFVALADDSASAHRDAVRAATPSALTRRFEGTLAHHFAIIIGALRTISLRAERALWRTVCDRTALALLYAGLACGEQDRAERLAHEILDDRPPLDSAPAYVDVRVNDRVSRAHLRRGCCLWWRTAAGEYCATCPIQRSTASALG